MWFGRKDNGFNEENIRRLVNVEAKLESYKQDVDSLRGLINRKLGNNKTTGDDDKNETNKNDDGLDSLREIYHGSQKGT